MFVERTAVIFARLTRFNNTESEHEKNNMIGSENEVEYGVVVRGREGM